MNIIPVIRITGDLSELRYVQPVAKANGDQGNPGVPGRSGLPYGAVRVGRSTVGDEQADLALVAARAGGRLEHLVPQNSQRLVRVSPALPASVLQVPYFLQHRVDTSVLVERNPGK